MQLVLMYAGCLLQCHVGFKNLSLGNNTFLKPLTLAAY